MTRLARVQDDFQAYMLRSDSAIESHVVGTQRVPVATRLGIYGDGYASRLVEALEANYPTLAKLLGPQDFATLGNTYVRARDSRFRSVRYYGAELADFLATEAKYAGAPVFAELARWEWAMNGAFDAADSAPMDATALSQVAPPEWVALRFEWHPSVCRLALLWNVPQVWKALTSGEQRPEWSVQAEPAQWLIWREDLKTFFRALGPPEAEALDAARSGASFGEICLKLATHFSEAEIPARAAGYLRQWLGSGLLTGKK
jgi:hypothetical protein